MDGAEYGQWLARRHKSSIPESLLRHHVLLATGSEMSAAQRLIVGQMNEVYDVTTASGRHAIVRISREDDPRFEGERWALDSARLRGVPTAEVFGIHRVEQEGRSITIEVQEKLPGVALQQLPPAARASHRLAESLGTALAGVHSVPVEGLGYLRADGRGWDITFADILLDLLDLRAELLAAAEHWRVEPAMVNRGLALLEAHSDAYILDSPVLVHGDLCPAHVLVDDDKVTGVIDFQDCSGGHPVLDFAKWHATCPPDFPVSRLRAGYGNQKLFDENFDLLFALVLLRQSLWMLMVRCDHENPYGLPRLLGDIEHSFQLLGDGK